MDFKDVLETIKDSLASNKKVEIYYPKTENSSEGWREIELINVTTDVPPNEEEVTIEKDNITPGHILNAYDVLEGKTQLKSFILGKIKNIRHL